jgi:tellurite methyltransferase
LKRVIVGYHVDDANDWVAELNCGHGQHVRHRPPFQLRHWVTLREGRQSRLGTSLDCPLCDRGELPDGLRFVRRSPEWGEATIPKGLLSDHKLADATWGVITVHRGTLRYVVSSLPPIDQTLGAGMKGTIPPEVAHRVHAIGVVRFSIDFFARVRLGSAISPPTMRQLPVEPLLDVGGDPACWAEQLCPACGAMHNDRDRGLCSELQR